MHEEPDTEAMVVLAQVGLVVPRGGQEGGAGVHVWQAPIIVTEADATLEDQVNVSAVVDAMTLASCGGPYGPKHDR